MKLRDRISHDQLRSLYDWWRDRRQQGDVLREAVQPQDILPWLPAIILLDCMVDGGFRYRLTGTEIDRRVGRNLTGMRLEDAREGVALQLIHAMLSTAARDNVAAYAKSCLMDDAERPVATYHRIALPLHYKAGGPVTTILGAWYIDWFPETPFRTIAAIEKTLHGRDEIDPQLLVE